MLRPGDGLGRDALFDVWKWKRAPTWWLRRNQQTDAWKIVWNFEERTLYSAPAKRALLRILPLNLWKGEFESLQTVGNSENIHWKNGEILEIQKATPLGTLSVSLKISRLVWLFGTPWGIRTPGLLVRSQTLYPAELTARVSYRTTVLYYHSFQGNARGNFKFLEKIFGPLKTMNLTRGVWQGYNIIDFDFLQGAHYGKYVQRQ